MNPPIPEPLDTRGFPVADPPTPRAEQVEPVAAQTVIQLFPRWLVIVLGVVGFVLAIGLLMWSLLAPQRFDATFSRTILALFFAFVAGLFLFILYPWHYRLVRIPYTDVALELVGPSALFVGLVLFIRFILPTPADLQVYDLRTEDGAEITQGTVFSEVVLTFTDGLDSRDYQLVLKPGAQVLEGVRIQFPENTTTRKATIHFSNYLKDQQVEFKRYGERIVRVKLEGK